MLDAFGRNIRYLRLSVTDLCNLSCRYCKPRPVPKLRHEDLASIDELMSFLDAFAALGFDKLRLTGGEPLLRKGLAALIEGGVQKGFTVGLTTNATLLAERAAELKSAGLSSVNVSLDTLDETVYRAVCGGDLADALRGIDAAVRQGFPLKVNAVLQRGVNDDPRPLIDYARSVGAELRLIELMPFATTADYVADRAPDSRSLLRQWGAVPIGREGKVDRYRLPDGATFGLIAPLTHPFCAACDRVRLTCKGELIPCLHRPTVYPLRPLRKRKDFVSILKSLIAEKPPRHLLAEGVYQPIDMGSIGG